MDVAEDDVKGEVLSPCSLHILFKPTLFYFLRLHGCVAQAVTVWDSSVSGITGAKS